MLTCVLIDDEQPCIDLLNAMIKQKLADKLAVAGTATEGARAIALIETAKPDVVFLDVEMPGVTGLQVLSHFPDRSFSVVFTTAHLGYALQALKKEAVDYLVKPISLTELKAAVEKCEKKAALLQHVNAPAPQGPKKILLSTSKGTLLVDLESIIRFESDNNYSTVHFTNAPKLVLSRTLKVFEDQLTGKGFFRLHQSHLVNLLHVRSYISGDVSYALLSNGDKVEIARRRRSDFLQAIKKNNRQ